MRLGKKFRKFFGFLNNTTRSGPRKRVALPWSRLDWLVLVLALVLVRMIMIGILIGGRAWQCGAQANASGSRNETDSDSCFYSPWGIRQTVVARLKSD